jgi:hypothetical protein
MPAVHTAAVIMLRPLMGLVIPGRPIRPLVKRTGAPKASTARVDRNPPSVRTSPYGLCTSGLGRSSRSQRPGGTAGGSASGSDSGEDATGRISRLRSRRSGSARQGSKRAATDRCGDQHGRWRTVADRGKARAPTYAPTCGFLMIPPNL